MPLSQAVQRRIHDFCDAWALVHRLDLVTAADRTRWGDEFIQFVEDFKNNFDDPVFQKFYEYTRAEYLRPGVTEGMLAEADLAVVDAYVQRVATVPV